MYFLSSDCFLTVFYVRSDKLQQPLLVKTLSRLKITCCPFTLRVEIVCFSETLAPICQTRRRHIPPVVFLCVDLRSKPTANTHFTLQATANTQFTLQAIHPTDRKLNLFLLSFPYFTGEQSTALENISPASCDWDVYSTAVLIYSIENSGIAGEGVVWGSTPLPPKFQSFDKVEPDLQFERKMFSVPIPS